MLQVNCSMAKATKINSASVGFCLFNLFEGRALTDNTHLYNRYLFYIKAIIDTSYS